MITTIQHSSHTAPSDELRSQRHAAEAVLAMLCGRAPARVRGLSLQGGVSYAIEMDADALRLSRGLLEDMVMLRLAGVAAAELYHGQGLPNDPARESARQLLLSGLTESEEKDVSDAHLQVLHARTRVALRRSWTEVQVVAAGLLLHKTLSAEEIGHRISCAQHLRGKTLN